MEALKSTYHLTWIRSAGRVGTAGADPRARPSRPPRSPRYRPCPYNWTGASERPTWCRHGGGATYARGNNVMAILIRGGHVAITKSVRRGGRNTSVVVASGFRAALMAPEYLAA